MTNINSPALEKPIRRRGRPAKADVSVSREALLLQAFNRFADRGFEGVSVRELAADLGVSDSLFHHYFRSKDQLWNEAVSQVLLPLQAQALQALHESDRMLDPIERLRESTRMVMMWAVNHRQVFRLIFREGDQDSERGAILRQYFDAFQQQVEAALQEGRRLGLVRNDLPLDAAHAMILGAARLLVEPGLMRERLAPVQKSDHAMTVLIDGIIDTLFRGLLREPAALMVQSAR